SSQNCGFIGSRCDNGTQCFDFNYSSGRIVTTNCYVDGVITNFARNNGFTAHGGTYGTKVINSSFLNCLGYGLGIRSRNSFISNNTIEGSNSSVFSYGLAIHEGSAVNTVVSNNNITLFNRGVAIIDGNKKDGMFQWIGIQILGNVFNHVNRVIHFDINSNNEIPDKSGVIISNNTVSSFTGQYGKFVITGGVNGIYITNNIVNDYEKRSNAGVYIVNSSEIVITDKIFNMDSHLWIEEVTIDKNLRIHFNSKMNYSSYAVIAPDEKVSMATSSHSSINPRFHDELSLGFS